MDELISIIVEDVQGNQRTLEMPTNMNLSLMEVLKASEYDIAATCGGMALCATCHVEVLKGTLSEPGPAELDMLDTLPVVSSNSRLACQIKVAPALSGLTIKLKG
jgi:ferredoxin-2, mitochondrial